MNSIKFPLFFTFLLIISLGTKSTSQDSLNMQQMAVTDPTSTTEKYNDVWGYRRGHKEYAILGKYTSTQIYDVTDCSNPVLVHEWTDGANTIWRDFKDYGDYIYGVCDVQCSEGLEIIKKDTWEHFQYTDDFVRSHNIHIDKGSGRLYVTGTNSLRDGLFVYDLTKTPSNPELLASVDFGVIEGSTERLYSHDIYIQNDTAYCSMENEYKIWDMKDLNNVFLISELDEGTGGYNHSSWKHPEQPYIYAAEETFGKPMYVYDISDLDNPYTSHTFKNPLLTNATDNIAHNPFVYLNRLYISYYHDGVQVYDVSDGATPVLLGYYDTFPGNTNYNGYKGAWGTYPFLASGCILGSDQTTGLHTLRMTVIPESRSTTDANVVLINNPTKGLVFVTPDDEIRRISINPDGTIANDLLTEEPVSKVENVNSNFEILGPNTNLLFNVGRSFNYRLFFDANNDLQTEIYPSVPTNATIIDNADIYFSQYRGGLIMQNPNGDCVHFTLGDTGTIETTAIDCSN